MTSTQPTQLATALAALAECAQAAGLEADAAPADVVLGVYRLACELDDAQDEQARLGGEAEAVAQAALRAMAERDAAVQQLRGYTSSTAPSPTTVELQLLQPSGPLLLQALHVAQAFASEFSSRRRGARHGVLYRSHAPPALWRCWWTPSGAVRVHQQPDTGEAPTAQIPAQCPD